MDESDYIKIGLMALFLIASAFFSGTETAFIALQRVRMIHLVTIGVPGAQRVFRMTQRPERFLPTVLLGNNVVNTAAAALGTAIVISIVDSTITALFILFLFSFNILIIGIIGEYITRIYDEVKTRPNYIIEDIIKKSD